MPLVDIRTASTGRMLVLMAEQNDVSAVGETSEDTRGVHQVLACAPLNQKDQAPAARVDAEPLPPKVAGLR
jgi:hypothetical protein